MDVTNETKSHTNGMIVILMWFGIGMSYLIGVNGLLHQTGLMGKILSCGLIGLATVLLVVVGFGK